MHQAHSVKPRTQLIVGLMTLCLSLGFSSSPWGRALDLLVGDFFFFLRGGQKAPTDIIIVAIDEPSFAVIQQPWPWPRGLHARLVDSLFQAGARVVAFDVVFAEPTSPDQDDLLFDALNKQKGVVLAADLHFIQTPQYTQQMLVGPHPSVFAPHASMGLVNLPSDGDGFVRRLPLTKAGLPSFSLEAARLFCDEGRECAGLKELGEDEYLNTYEINYLGPPRTVKIISYYQALSWKDHLPPGTFHGALVVVGLVTGINIEGKEKGVDSYPVPFSRWYGGYMAGTEIHANAMHSLMQGSLLRMLPNWWGPVSCLVIGLLSLFVFFRLNLIAASVLLFAAVILCMGTAFWLFTVRFVRLPTSYCLAPILTAYFVSPFFHYWKAWREKNFIRKAFSTYLAPSVVNQLLAQPSRLKLGGELVEATVLFLDIAGFTSFSEHIRPEDLVLVLNRYLGAFTNIVLRWDGMVDKFIGDAVMATWGVPLGQPDHACRACHAALEMVQAVQAINSETGTTDTRPDVRIRIGINSGRMLAGNVGGGRHFNYTVLGDEVNLASRLEGVNREYGTTIMVGESTSQWAAGRFALREIDRVRVKGKRLPVRIFELQGEKDEFDQAMQDVNRYFEEGKRLYEQKQWDEAIEYFEKSLALKPGDGPSHTFLARCRQFLNHPPSPEWDGVTALEK